MAFQKVLDLDAETTISIGGFNKKTKRDNPTEIEGYFLGTRQVESKKSKTGFSAIHYFQTSKGNVAVWGKTDMDRKLGNVTPGLMVRLSFDKMQATPNGEMYKYKVEFDPENTIEVGTLAAGAQTVQPESYETEEELESEEVDEDTQQVIALEQAARAKRVQDMLRTKSAKK